MTGEWRIPWSYAVGDLVLWRGVRLVCTRAHHAGCAAVDPWDPGSGWKPELAATLWTPDGEAQAARLKALVIDERGTLGDEVRRVALLAATVEHRRAA